MDKQVNERISTTQEDHPFLQHEVRKENQSCEEKVGENITSDTFVRVINDFNEARTIINNCSIVVGMHPDQAAGHIVDFALAQNKPFALVPCCVYSKEFPKRRLKDGTPVKTYSHLITYLMEKHSGIKKCTLPFEGKNICVYKTI
eukprot:m.35405 g.35405  ORF g.35405 m.35405 type:complete len:145 (-) comp10014_c0_seq1:151-585(-)